MKNPDYGNYSPNALITSHQLDIDQTVVSGFAQALSIELPDAKMNIQFNILYPGLSESYEECVTEAIGIFSNLIIETLLNSQSQGLNYFEDLFTALENYRIAMHNTVGKVTTYRE